MLRSLSRSVSALNLSDALAFSCPRLFRNASDPASDNALALPNAGPCPDQLSLKEPETPLGRQLKQIIRFGDGPMTVAEFMQVHKKKSLIICPSRT